MSTIETLKKFNQDEKVRDILTKVIIVLGLILVAALVFRYVI